MYVSRRVHMQVTSSGPINWKYRVPYRHSKLQTRPLVREGAIQEEQNKCKKGKDKIWSWAPKGSPIPGPSAVT
jgi:hypothetical protein